LVGIARRRRFVKSINSNSEIGPSETSEGRRAPFI
jgi:hypothetical protein